MISQLRLELNELNNTFDNQFPLSLFLVDGGVGAWMVWNDCSATCGTGTRTRTRLCDDPPPANDGAECPAEQLTEMEACEGLPCPGKREAIWFAAVPSWNTGTFGNENHCQIHPEIIIDFENVLKMFSEARK